MQKIRGFIDPYTLGFLIALIGGATVFVVHGNKPAETASATETSQQAIVVTEIVDDSELFD